MSERKLRSVLKDAQCYHCSAYLTEQETKELMDEIDCDKFVHFNLYFWDQETQTIKTVPNSRKSYWVGDYGQAVQEDEKIVTTKTGDKIKIPSDILPAYQFPPVLLKLKQRIETEFDMCFNSVLVARYENSKAKIGYHSDANDCMGPDPQIASLSLGFRRRFNLKRKGFGRVETKKLVLENGDLLLMKEGCNRNYLHEVPPDGWCNKKNFRINLTFRNYPYDHSEYQIVAKPW